MGHLSGVAEVESRLWATTFIYVFQKAHLGKRLTVRVAGRWLKGIKSLKSLPYNHLLEKSYSSKEEGKKEKKK